MYPKSIKNLIDSFKYFPGIGEKTAERLAFSVLNMDDDQIEMISKSISTIKKDLKRCSICNNFSEDDICSICSDNLIIIAVKPCIEGEMTALYINNILSGRDLNVTRLASGIPMGADMDYVDALTLERAFDNRKNID